MEKYKVLDLFAGCGGLSKGFEQAGFEIVVANDIWEPAMKTYVRNHPAAKFILGDITNQEIKQQILDAFKDKPCDVIIGGPPCQAYSLAGLRDPGDPRGRLFEEYVEIVEKLQPKLFVLENVKGILTMMHDREDLQDVAKNELSELRKLEKEKAGLLLLRKKSKNNAEKFKFTKEDAEKLDDLKSEIKELKDRAGSAQEKVTEKIERGFKEIGYDVKFEVLNAADFGVPQTRERVIFIGKKEDGPISFPKPTHSKNPVKDGLRPWKTVQEAIDDLRDRQEDLQFNHIITAHNKEFIGKIRNTPIGANVFGNYSDAFYKNPPNVPSRTVKENHGGVFVHYGKDRVMTPRELARLQSFPDDFIFEDTKSNILKQIGNAVPVGLARAIGEHIIKLIEEKN